MAPFMTTKLYLNTTNAQNVNVTIPLFRQKDSKTWHKTRNCAEWLLYWRILHLIIPTLDIPEHNMILNNAKKKNHSLKKKKCPSQLKFVHKELW